MQHNLNDMGTPIDLALHRIDVAKEDLETAENNYSENHLRAANNRAHYDYWVDTLPFYRNVQQEGVVVA